eukprot:1174351-Karenia_brevis.AAC.1
MALRFRQCPIRKAYGEDLLCGEVFREFSSDLAMLLYPLHFKIVCRIQVPLQHKGGMVVEYFKNKGASEHCGSYRDIMLTNDGGKSFAKLLRKKLMPIARAITLSSQCGGGLHGGETAIAH